MDIHKRFGCVQPEKTQSPVGPVTHQQRHRPVQAETVVQLIAEGVQVIQPIRFAVSVK